MEQFQIAYKDRYSFHSAVAEGQGWQTANPSGQARYS